MAKVVIEITDTTNAEVNIRLESEPGWPGPKAEDQTLTVAQALGLQFLDILRKEGVPHD